MTFALTSGVDDAHPIEPQNEELTSANDAHRYIGDHCLDDGPVGQVGLEVEAHCFDLTDPMRRPRWDELTEIISGIPVLPGGSAVTVEPGGAVELSGPPMDGPLPAITAMQADRAALRATFAQAGLGLVLLGADPLRPAKRVNPGARYQAMETFFKASDTGAAGAAMMTSTASIQVNLDAGPHEGWADRVRLAHALGPTMVAIAANSPLLGGKFAGWRSARQHVWSQLDSARCGPVLGASGDDPASDWARYALKAPVMLVNTAEVIPLTTWVPFADWADGRVLLGDRRPTHADLDYHLTTLFPPVRPRRWLEIRYLDSVPDDVWPAVAFTLVTLLDDPAAADIAAEATESVATAWDRAAQIGLGDRRLAEAALKCVQTAAERAPVELEESMQRLVRSVEQGRSPADDFSDRVVEHGIAPAVTQLAQGES
ncbi:ergothioneine biosynthesis glutamate--cysteine ligase EgtA [Mycobacterium sp. NPDC051804]|uniref:ergothioneine biosynthesis glutamate--cysteine ligase EgtA n=1 Tax=Mycobacterium sp. NPDC051804 TaxID=3364295 RepID=UPI00379BDA69